MAENKSYKWGYTREMYINPMYHTAEWKLFEAVMDENIPSIKSALIEGADVNHPDYRSVAEAINRDYVDILKLLVEAGLDPAILSLDYAGPKTRAWLETVKLKDMNKDKAKDDEPEGFGL